MGEGGPALESPQLFIIKTADGSVYSGRLSTVELGKDQPIEFQVDLVFRRPGPHPQG